MRWSRWWIGISMTDRAAEERSFKGIGVSGGIASGPLHRLAETAAIPWRGFTTLEEETALFRQALASARGRIEAAISAQDRLAGEILEFQLALLEDDEFLAPVHRALAGGMPADKAWVWVLDAEIADYRKGGGILAERAADLADLKTRVLRAIQGQEAETAPLPDGAIIVAGDLIPSAFLELDWSRIGGAATLGGSPTSHVAILARARGVNLVVGLAADLDALPQGAPAILDAARGILIVNPRAATVASMRDRLALASEDGKAIAALLRRPAVTAAGERVQTLLNIDEPGLLDRLDPAIGDGVGLTRTEFLFASGPPGEEEQFAFYSRLIGWAGERPVTIRTLDAGGDKPVPGLTVDGEANPFLGLRGLRLSLARPEVFRVQLRALARAAVLGPLKVMVPMVTVPAELAAVREMLRAEIADLQRAGVACAMPPLGMMVEVPAAALTAASFDADFYSIGSNDLIQYVTAAARDNAGLTALADPANPAVLELIARVVETGRRRGVEVSLCGDMASTPVYVGLLLDRGLRALSCAPAQIGPVKLAVSRYGQGSGAGHHGEGHGGR
jgi:phosphotransferase system enzyme I (PtsI)